MDPWVPRGQHFQSFLWVLSHIKKDYCLIWCLQTSELSMKKNKKLLERVNANRNHLSQRNAPRSRFCSHFFLPTLPLRFKDPIRVDQCVQWLLIVAIRKQCVKFKRKTKKLFSVMPIWGNSSGEDNWVLTKEDEKQIQHARPLSNLFCHLEVLILLFTDQIIGPVLDEKTNINYYLEYLIGAKLPSVFCCCLRGPDPVVTSTP